MNKTVMIFGAIMISALFFKSCTIEKRVHLTGYHIKWKTGNGVLAKGKLEYNNTRERTELNKTVPVEQSELVDYKVEDSTETINQNIISLDDNESLLIDLKEVNKSTTNHKRDIHKLETTINTVAKSDLKNGIKTFPKTSNEAPKINTLGLISFICVILSLFFVGGVLPSLLLGAIALGQFKNNPEKYNNKWMATFAVVFGYIGCSVGMIFSFSIAAFFFEGPFWLILAGICLIDIIVSTSILAKKPAHNNT